MRHILCWWSDDAFECGLGALYVWFCFWQEELSILCSSYSSLMQMARLLSLASSPLPWHFLSRFHCTFVKAFFSTSPISPPLLLPVPLILLCLLSSSCFSLLFPQCCWAQPRSFPHQGWPTCCMATVLTNLPHQPDWLHQIMSFSQPNLLQSSHSHCM